MNKKHYYKATITWTGNKGSGTSNYRAYEREYSIDIEHKQTIFGSSDPAFRGDKTRHNPEEMLLASLSSCHMLWYLHLCSEANIVITSYLDNATGLMEETPDGGGRFVQVVLHPEVIITDPKMIELANELHHRANQLCFIANSVNFPIAHKPITKV